MWVFLQDYFILSRPVKYSRSKRNKTCLLQVFGARTRAWRWVVWLPGQKGSTHAERSKEIFQANHFRPRLLPQSFHLVSCQSALPPKSTKIQNHLAHFSVLLQHARLFLKTNFGVVPKAIYAAFHYGLGWVNSRVKKNCTSKWLLIKNFQDKGPEQFWGHCCCWNGGFL